MTFEQIVQEVTDRGFDYIKTARIQRFVNRSYQKICARRPWPFLEETATGTAPLSITDVRHVLSVSDTSGVNSLDSIDPRRLAVIDPAMTGTGSPQFWYLQNGEIKVYPASEATLSVRYIKKPADLSGSETPLVPSDFHEVIVDGAVYYCLKDDDELGGAREMREEVDADINEMVHALMGSNYQRSEFIERSGSVGDYL